jgi:hypothetical protein
LCRTTPTITNVTPLRSAGDGLRLGVAPFRLRAVVL